MSRRLAFGRAVLAALLLVACTQQGPVESVPRAPSDVQATADEGAIVLTWTDLSTNEHGFRIYREVASPAAITALAMEAVGTVLPNVTTYVDADVVVGTFYRYAVTAFNAVGETDLVTQESPAVSPSPLTYLLSVSLAGDGEGVVVSQPSGVDCGAECSASYSEGESVSLTATPASGSTFAGWAGDCSGTSTTCVLTMDDNHDAVAIFDVVPLPPPGESSLSVLKAGTGQGTVISDPSGIDCGPVCVSDFEDGTMVTLTALPASGITFGGWSGACVGSGLACQVEMTVSKAVVATFLDTYTLGVAVVGTGAGVVTSTPSGIACGSDCQQNFVEGTSVTLVAEPDAYSSFTGWSGAGCAGAATCVVEMNADKDVTASFSLSSYSLNVDVDGPGSVTSSPSGIDCEGDCSETFQAGVTVELTATPDDGAEFLSWSGACRGTSPTCSVLINAAKDVTVRNGHGGSFGGGGILVDRGRLELIGATIRDNQTDRGAGIRGGGVLNDGGVVVVTSSTFTNNDLSNMIWEAGPTTGAAIAVVAGDLSMTNSVVTANLAEYVAGIHVFGTDSSVVIQDSVISDNMGLGIDNEGSLWMEHVDYQRNNLDYHIGGLRNAGVAYLTDVTISRNGGEGGAGIVNTGFLRLRDSTVSHNINLDWGIAGISNQGRMEIFNTDVLENRSDSDIGVGGISNSGQMEIRGSRILDNEGIEGGGVANSGDLYLIDTMVDGNQAFIGGGIYSTGPVYLQGTTQIGTRERGNEARSGGGVALADAWRGAGSLYMSGTSSILGNRAVSGGGIYAPLGHISICDTCELAWNSADRFGTGTGLGGGIYGAGFTTYSYSVSSVHDNYPDDVAPGGALTAVVATSGDDAEEFRSATTNPAWPPGSVYVDGLDLELTFDDRTGLYSDQVVGVRFGDVQVPAGAYILDARIQFTVDATDGPEANPTSIPIYMESSPNPAPYVAAMGTYGISGRPKTYQIATWTPDAWDVPDASGPAQMTPSLRYAVQQRVNDPAWAQGNAMAFIFGGDTMKSQGNTRTAFAFDRAPEKVPRLIIHYVWPHE